VAHFFCGEAGAKFEITGVKQRAVRLVLEENLR